MVSYIRVLNVKVKRNETFSLTLTSNLKLFAWTIKTPPSKVFLRIWEKDSSRLYDWEIQLKIFLRLKKSNLIEFLNFLSTVVRFCCVTVFPGKTALKKALKQYLFKSFLIVCLPIYERFMSIKDFTFHVALPTATAAFPRPEILFENMKTRGEGKVVFGFFLSTPSTSYLLKLICVFPAVLPNVMSFRSAQRKSFLKLLCFGLWFLFLQFFCMFHAFCVCSKSGFCCCCFCCC